MAGTEAGRYNRGMTEQDGFRQLAQRIAPGSRVLRVWALTGGVSATVTGLELQLASGATCRFLVRRHGEADLERNPTIARDEFRLLGIARRQGLAVPEPVYLDETLDLFPDPVLVLEHVEGHPEFEPQDMPGYLSRMVDELVRIHSVAAEPELDFLPRIGKGFSERPAQLDDSLGEGRIRDALEAPPPLLSPNSPVLLHGDYWPGNILWREGEIAAVIDWEDAATGDPLVDLANTRLELLFFFGHDAMQTFTDLYLSRTTVDAANLPYWDLCAALRPCSKLSTWGLDPATETRMRERHHQFVAAALKHF